MPSKQVYECFQENKEGTEIILLLLADRLCEDLIIYFFLFRGVRYRSYNPSIELYNPIM